MVKKSPPPPKAAFTYDQALKIAQKRAKANPVRVANNASSATGAAAAGSALTGLLFANAFEEAAAERDATERMQAAAQSDPVVCADGGQLIVPVDGLVALCEREHTIDAVSSMLKSPDTSADVKDDLVFATRLPVLFWNVVHHVGGAAAVREADCSVVAACAAHLMTGADKLDMAGGGGSGGRRRRRARVETQSI